LVNAELYDSIMIFSQAGIQSKEKIFYCLTDFGMSGKELILSQYLFEALTEWNNFLNQNK